MNPQTQNRFGSTLLCLAGVLAFSATSCSKAPGSGAGNPVAHSDSAARAASAGPDCSNVNGWTTSIAFGHLKNAGLTDNDRLDFSKTRTIRLASERIGDDLYRQVHRVTFTEKSGTTLEVITVNDASNDECSMSGVDAYVVSKHLGETK